VARGVGGRTKGGWAGESNGMIGWCAGRRGWVAGRPGKGRRERSCEVEVLAPDHAR